MRRCLIVLFILRKNEEELYVRSSRLESADPNSV